MYIGSTQCMLHALCKVYSHAIGTGNSEGTFTVCDSSCRLLLPV